MSNQVIIGRSVPVKLSVGMWTKLIYKNVLLLKWQIKQLLAKWWFKNYKILLLRFKFYRCNVVNSRQMINMRARSLKENSDTRHLIRSHGFVQRTRAWQMLLLSLSSVLLRYETRQLITCRNTCTPASQYVVCASFVDKLQKRPRPRQLRPKGNRRTPAFSLSLRDNMRADRS